MDPRAELLCRADAALLVIDVQERINKAMADQGHVPRIAALAQAFERLGRPVLLSEQYPKGLGPTVPELARRTASAGDGDQAHGDALVKDTFSCLRDAGIAEALRATAPRQVVVTGIEAHVCVAATALDLLAAGYAVHVPHDAVCSRRARDREWALHRMAAAGAVITSTESVLFEMVERCGTDEFRSIAALVKTIPVDL
jgi:nicotinamidase-related amidase